jgi:hypothetical protein
MTFSQAVNRTPSVQGHLKPGVKALSRVDRRRVACDGRRLRGSVDIDAALRVSLPNDARWDYAVGVQKGGNDHVVWIEVHPASSHHVDEVLSKARWLLRWLAASAPVINGLPRRFCWIATGTVSFSRGSPQARRLAGMGLRFPVKHADLEEVLCD